MSVSFQDRDTGWMVKNQPPGFKKIMEMKRFKPGAQAPIAHLVYSDGLAAVSVFIEPAATKHPTPQAGLMRQGAINVYTRPVGGYWVTVVGEAPAESVKYIANAVEFLLGDKAKNITGTVLTVDAGSTA